jgi:hypothetical protein
MASGADAGQNRLSVSLETVNWEELLALKAASTTPML